MDPPQDFDIEKLIDALPYVLNYLQSRKQSPTNHEQKNITIISLLKEKVKNLEGIIARIYTEIEETKTLEHALLSYLDYQILKVENHLIKIDFWQNHNLHKDVIQLRTQMQQQLFQLEEEKVRTRVQLHAQLIQLNKDFRMTLQDLQAVQTQLLFLEQNGRLL